MKRFGKFTLDAANQCLWQDGAQITIAPKPFAVLSYLVDNPGRLITHDELLDRLWPDTYVQPQVLRTYMLELRKILGDDPRQPRFIQSLPKRGYRFVAEVREESKPSTTTVCSEPSESGLVGRSEELASLRAAFQTTQAGTRQFVFVTGESGLGKSALVDEFCNSLVPQATIARGQCIQGFADKEHYYPVLEALAQLCGSARGEVACATLARVAPSWMSTSPHPPQELHTAAPARSAAELCAALEELAAESSLVLVFEDLHWADEATLDLLSALVRRRTPARLLLIATLHPQRAGAIPTFRRIRQDLLMRRLCTEIVLGSLSRTSVKQLLCIKLAQGEIPAHLDAFVHRHSEGNPLFVHLLVDHLIAQGSLVRLTREGAERWEASADALDAGVPDGLAQMIELDIESLTPREQSLLEAGSLSEIAFPSWAVAAALNEDLVSAEEACDELARRVHLVRRAGYDELPDGSRVAFYVFAHGLYREVLYQRQPESRRAQRHIRIAERLGELFPGREAHVAREIAGHYEAAGNWMQAIASFRAAANYAQERGSYATAVELLQDALRMAGRLRLPEREDLQHELRQKLAQAIEFMTGLDEERSSLEKV